LLAYPNVQSVTNSTLKLSSFRGIRSYVSLSYVPTYKISNINLFTGLQQ